MTIEERATNYAAEIYGWEEQFKSSIIQVLLQAEDIREALRMKRRFLLRERGGIWYHG